MEANSAVTSGYSMTVSGLNFGVDATTPTSTIGLSSCATASWASTSSVVCMISTGEGVGLELRVTVAGVVGSHTASFSYDGMRALRNLPVRWSPVCVLVESCSPCKAPLVSYAGACNAAASVGWSVTVSGMSFGTLNVTPSSRVGFSSCLTSSWVSSTSAACQPSGGQGVAHDGDMTVAAIVGTRTKMFSYDGSIRFRGS